MLTINKFVWGKISMFHTKNCSSENSWQETFHWRYLPKNDSENNVFTGIDRRFHSWQKSHRDIIFYCYSPILFTPEFQDCCIIHSANDDKCFGFEETLTFDVCVLASFSRSTIVAVCSHVEDLLHLLIYCFHFLADSLVNISDA